MSSEVYARVVFESPIPALNREFEYSVPDELIDVVQVGQRVRVPFARAVKEGFIVGLLGEKEFAGELSAISEIVSPVGVLTPHIYELLKLISRRQACAVGELLTFAIPNRSVRIEKNFSFSSNLKELRTSKGLRVAETLRPVANAETGTPQFIDRIFSLAMTFLEEGRSVVIAMPDHRDCLRMAEQFASKIDQLQLNYLGANPIGSERYHSFLRQLDGEPQIVIGTRNVIYSPLPADSALIVWDDGDQSHQDQQAPYLTTREIALLRQSLADCPLHFLSHSRSTEIQRLCEIGYLDDVAPPNWWPKVAVSLGRGLDGMAFKAIREGLQSGPVLVQVATPGVARSLYCQTCGQRSTCSTCYGPLWSNSKGQIVCRWCGRFNLNHQCRDCGDSKLRQGSAGSTRWVKQLGLSFPGVPIREFTGESANCVLENKPSIAVCTPGVEQVAVGGYSTVVLLDCASQLSIDSLRAPEDALRSWLNALGFLRPGGTSVAVGISSEVSAALTLGKVNSTVSEMLAEREQLGFPPAKRFMSAVGARGLLLSLATELESIEDVRILGIAEAITSSNEKDHRLLVSFSYAVGQRVADATRQFLGKLPGSQSRTSQKSGRTIRPISIKFDDPRVL
jgi:primosomal protein N' (replication factor Y)